VRTTEKSGRFGGGLWGGVKKKSFVLKKPTTLPYILSNNTDIIKIERALGIVGRGEGVRSKRP